MTVFSNTEKKVVEDFILKAKLYFSAGCCVDPDAVWTRTRAMTKLVKIVAILTAKTAQAEALKALLDGMTGPSRAEAGCLRYDLWRDQANAERFVLDELYVDDAAIAAHKETAHFRDYLARIADLAERTAFVVDGVDVS